MIIWIYTPYDHIRTALLDSFDRCEIMHNNAAPDDMEITTQLTGSSKIVKVDSILWPVGDSTAYLVHSVDMMEKKNGAVETRIRARSMETLLSMRALKAPKTYTGVPGEVCTRMCMDVFEEAGRAFPGLTFDFSAATGEPLTLEASGKLIENVQAVLACAACGIRSSFDPHTCTIRIYVRPGVERSIVFDEMYETFAEMNYSDDIINAAQVCYVSDAEGHVEQIGQTALSGYRRREGWTEHTAGRESTDADGNEIMLTDAQYVASMRDTGIDYLADHRRAQLIEGEVSLESKLVRYGIEFELGDVCTVRKVDWGIEERKRLTSVLLTFERGAKTLRAVFGDPCPTLSDKIKRGD